jgi:hypothetical protein
MPRARVSALLSLTFLSTLAACAHAPPSPPPGMASLIVKCCQLYDDGDSLICQPLTEDLRIQVDGQEAGTCRTWARDGKVLAAGPHKIEIDARSPPTREGECCLEQTVALTLLSGEVHTEEFRLNVIEYPD